jgi:DNA-directed RNA polymerase specialized sigma24 family protein
VQSKLMFTRPVLNPGRRTGGYATSRGPDPGTTMHVDSTSAPARTRARSSIGARVPPLNEIRAHRAAAENYERHRAAVMHGVREKLRKVGADAPHQEIDAGYNLAWNSLIALRASGATVESEVGWLVTTTFRRVIDWLRLEHYDLRERDGVESDEIAELLAADEGSLEHHVDQQRRLRSLLEAFRHRFTGRETLILFYAYVLDMPRPEIAEALDIPLKRLHKLLDGYEVRQGRAGSAEAVRAHGLKDKLAKYIDVIASGDWCETHESLIRAHALGWFEPGSAKHTAATTHLKNCAACRRYFQAKRGIAMLLPPVSLPILDGTHGATLLDPLVGIGRSVANTARSLLGIAGPSDAAVATGAGAGGTAVVSTLLGGAGAKIIAACVTALAAVCVATVAIPSSGGTPHTKAPSTVSAAPIQATAVPQPIARSQGSSGTTSLFASSPLLAPDALGVGGLRLYDFEIENQGSLPRRRHSPRRHQAPAATQATPAPAPASSAPAPDSSTAAPTPSQAQPAPAQPPSHCEFSFEC